MLVMIMQAALTVTEIDDKINAIMLSVRGGTVVKVLRYKSKGRWFDPRWCHWNFSLTYKILPIALWSWGRLSL